MIVIDLSPLQLGTPLFFFYQRPYACFLVTDWSMFLAHVASDQAITKTAHSNQISQPAQLPKSTLSKLFLFI